MKKCFAWVLVLAMLLSMCGVVIAAEGAPVASAADVVIEPQNAAPAAQDAGEGEALERIMSSLQKMFPEVARDLGW